MTRSKLPPSSYLRGVNGVLSCCGANKLTDESEIDCACYNVNGVSASNSFVQYWPISIRASSV